MCTECLNQHQFPRSPTPSENPGPLPETTQVSRNPNPARGPESLPDGIPPKNNPKVPQ